MKRFAPVLLSLVLLAATATTALTQQPQDIWEPRISIVWPHNGQGSPTTTAQSRAVNIGVWPRNQVSCAATPVRLNLWRAVNNEPAEPVGTEPQLVQRTEGGSSFPALEYNDVPADLAANPTSKYRFVVQRDNSFGNVWVHAADPRTFYPQPVVPTGFAEDISLDPRRQVDAWIQIVWPHDEQGNFAPVSQATRVNIAVDIFEHGTWQSVPLDYPPPPTGPGIGGPIGLYVARGNEEMRFPPLQSAAWAHSQKVTYTANGQTFPRWIFNDVPVEPGNQHHFLVKILGDPETYSTIWTHAEDARTILPHPEPPPPCLPW